MKERVELRRNKKRVLANCLTIRCDSSERWLVPTFSFVSFGAFNRKSAALAVNNLGTVFLVVFSSDPAGCEGAEGSEGRSTLPDSVLAVGSGNNADLGAGGSEGNNFVLKAINNTFVHGSSTREDNVLAELLTDIDIGGRD
jgi:hypothetical protein